MIPPPPVIGPPVPLSFEEQTAPGSITTSGSLSDFQRNKPVDSRKNRPAWAQTEQALMRHLLSPSLLRRWQIALRYWLQNRTAREIAEEMGISLQAVKDVLRRLKGR